MNATHFTLPQLLHTIAKTSKEETETETGCILQDVNNNGGRKAKGQFVLARERENAVDEVPVLNTARCQTVQAPLPQCLSETHLALLCPTYVQFRSVCMILIAHPAQWNPNSA